MDRNSSSQTFRAAFVSTELLNIIAIIGILIALLLPALQSARESVRKNQCSNNIHQLALGVLSYQEIKQTLPLLGCCSLAEDKLPPGTRQKYRYPRINSIAALMPFFEQGTTSQNILSVWETDDHYNSIAQVTPAFPVMGVQVPFLRCPSDKAEPYRDTESGAPLASRSYVYCSGDWPEAGIYQYIENINGYKQLTESSLAKINLFNNNTRTGIPCCWPYRKISEIGDGASNTILWSEKTLGKANSRSIKESSLVLPFAVPAYDASPEETGSPADCLKASLRTGRKGNFWDDSAGFVETNNSGVRAYDANAQYATFSTILPPNSPMCHHSADGRVLHSATSYHANGVNVAFYDGSVRFISDKINSGDFVSAKIKSKGPSDFGVWGALGSINGEEKTPL